MLQRGSDLDGSWATRALRENPGALLCAAVAPHGATIALRDERTIAATASGAAVLPFDASVLPSAIYALEIGGRFATGLPEHITVTAGGHTAHVRLDGQRADS